MSDTPTISHIVSTPYLAWDNPGSGERNFRIIVTTFLVVAFLMALVVEMTTVPKPDRRDIAKVPERIAKLVMEKKKAEPPPKEPEKELVVEEKPKPKPEPVPEDRARETARKALQEVNKELEALKDLASAFDMKEDIALSNDGAESVQLSRDIIAGRAGKAADKLAFGEVSRGGGGTGIEGGGKLAAAMLATVDSNITEGPTGAVRKTESGGLVRTQEEVRRVMDRNNGALQAIYQRALRSNPMLRGAVVLRLVIAPDGAVSRCELVSSELNDPEAEQKLISRIRAINFGAIQGVAIWDENYTLNFFSG